MFPKKSMQEADFELLKQAVQTNVLKQNLEKSFALEFLLPQQSNALKVNHQNLFINKICAFVAKIQDTKLILIV